MTRGNEKKELERGEDRPWRVYHRDDTSHLRNHVSV